jgi:hypothetical protein
MGFLRRFRGGDPDPGPASGSPGAGADAGNEGDATPVDDASSVDDEAARDRELMREEAERLQDELLQRQLRYADRSWTPPDQGGPQRSGETGSEDGG